MSRYSAVILASGQARRLGNICSQRPKSMLPFDGIPFLRYLICWLLRNGVDDVIVTGSRSCHGEIIAKEISDHFPSNVQMVMELSPQSTVRSTLFGLPMVKHRDVLLITGDSIWDVDPQSFHRLHLDKRSACSVLVTIRVDTPNYGLVKLDRTSGRILSMADYRGEFDGIPTSTIGFYMVDVARFLDAIDPDHDLRVEREPMQRLIPDVWGVRNDSFYWDYGTPEKLAFLTGHPSIIRKYFGTPDR